MYIYIYICGLPRQNQAKVANFNYISHISHFLSDFGFLHKRMQ